MTQDDGPLTDEEQYVFFDLLKRICVHHIDQWLLMRTETRSGPFFIKVSMGPEEGADPDLYAVVPDSLLDNQTAAKARMLKLMRAARDPGTERG